MFCVWLMRCHIFRLLCLAWNRETALWGTFPDFLMQEGSTSGYGSPDRSAADVEAARKKAAEIEDAARQRAAEIEDAAHKKAAELDEAARKRAAEEAAARVRSVAYLLCGWVGLDVVCVFGVVSGRFTVVGAARSGAVIDAVFCAVFRLGGAVRGVVVRSVLCGRVCCMVYGKVWL
jgi:hypothetical protein